jgi:hypothetical protein
MGAFALFEMGTKCIKGRWQRIKIGEQCIEI